MRSHPAATTRLPGRTSGVFLLVCGPVVVDLLFGATQLSSIVALVPEVLTYGCAAVLIRGLARRSGAGWPTVILWAVAFALVAECLIVQTSLAPLGGPHPGWGRALGVNWPYLLWALGYESVWGIAISIQLTDLLFPSHRGRPWPSGRGLGLLAAVFVLGSVSTWFNYTRVVAPRLLHHPIYHPPPVTLAAGLAAGMLIALGSRSARWVPQAAVMANGRWLPSPAGVGLAAFVAGGLWFALTVWPQSVTAVSAHVPADVPLVLAGITATAAMAVLHRWSQASGWSDQHRLALITGALIASMSAGFVLNHFTGRVDLIGKATLNIAALLGLFVLHHRLPTSEPSPPVPLPHANRQQRVITTLEGPPGPPHAADGANR
jgi:hypothetical protein